MSSEECESEGRESEGRESEEREDIMIGVEKNRLRSRPQLPRYRRSEDAPALVLQRRDHALLKDLWRYRWLTTSQIETLRNSDAELSLRFASRLTLTRRLKLLFHNGYLRRIARPLAQGSMEPVYVLDGEGARALSKEHGEVTARAPSQLPKAMALDHLLAVGQARVALTAACAASAIAQLKEWRSADAAKFSVMLALPGERTRRVTLIPDGFFVLKVREEHQNKAEGEKNEDERKAAEHRKAEENPKIAENPKGRVRQLFYFVEVDKGSEPGKVLGEKCRAYYAYWQSGGFAGEYSLPAGMGFRVLFIAPGEKRAATVAGAIRALPAGRTLFWTALETSIVPEQILEPVWREETVAALRRLC
jgi:hypothetical protein